MRTLHIANGLYTECPQSAVFVKLQVIHHITQFEEDLDLAKKKKLYKKYINVS